MLDTVNQLVADKAHMQLFSPDEETSIAVVSPKFDQQVKSEVIFLPDETIIIVQNEPRTIDVITPDGKHSTIVINKVKRK